MLSRVSRGLLAQLFSLGWEGSSGTVGSLACDTPALPSAT